MTSFSIAAAGPMRAGALFLALLAAVPAFAQTAAPIRVAMGEAVSLTIADDGTVDVSPQRGAAEWRPFDVAAGRHLSGMPIPDAPVPFGTPFRSGGDIPPPPAVEPGRVRVKLLSIAGQHSLLVLENGYDRAIAYRARMTRGDRVSPTDVCVVMPRRHGFEHWAFVIDRLELYDFRFVAWQEGDPIPCA